MRGDTQNTECPWAHDGNIFGPFGGEEKGNACSSDRCINLFGMDECNAGGRCSVRKEDQAMACRPRERSSDPVITVKVCKLSTVRFCSCKATSQKITSIFNSIPLSPPNPPQFPLSRRCPSITPLNTASQPLTSTTLRPFPSHTPPTPTQSTTSPTPTNPNCSKTT